MKTLVSAAAVAAIAGSAFGLGETLDRSSFPIFTTDTPGITITHTPLHEAATTRGPLAGLGTSVYGWDDTTPGYNYGSGYFASPPATGVNGFEDYGSTLSASGPPDGTPTNQFDTMNTISYQFIGGSYTTNGIMFFDFYFNDFSYANGFGVSFGPYLGAYLWTITFGGSSVTVPTEGYHAVVANTDSNIGTVTNGIWFLSDLGANPAVGHNDLAWDSGNTGGTAPVNLGYLFALGVPTPGTAAVMGLAGLAGVTRRRR
jgi:hypothetical protein